MGRIVELESLFHLIRSGIVTSSMVLLFVMKSVLGYIMAMSFGLTVHFQQVSGQMQ